MLSGKKAFFAGVNSADKPGSIQVISYPSWQKTSELQVHSSGVSRMCMNFEQSLLFTGSYDGSFSIL